MNIYKIAGEQPLLTLATTFTLTVQTIMAKLISVFYQLIKSTKL